MQIFNPENTFWRTVARVVDVFGLSICWVFCSLLIVTVGAATTALYDSVYHCLRKGESGTYVRFFKTLIRELKTTLPFSIVGVGLGVLAWHVSGYAAAEGVTGIMACTGLALMCIPLAIWLFAMFTLSRFSFNAAGLLVTATKLVFSHLLSALAVIVLALALWYTITWWYFSAMFLPALAVWIMSLLMERIFAPFIEKENGGEDSEGAED